MLAALSRMVPAASLNGSWLSPIGELLPLVFIGGCHLNTAQLIILDSTVRKSKKYNLQRRKCHCETHFHQDNNCED